GGDRLGRLAGGSVLQRAIQQLEGPPLRLARVRSERFVATLRLDPARRDRHQLLVEAFRSLPIEGQPPEQYDAWDRIRDLGETGARQVVVHEALCPEAREQPLRHPLRQV